MTTFVLVHGGGHRGWHWNLVRPVLESLGHHTIAPDVPMDDPQAGVKDWADVVVRSMRGAEADDLVVVGHSLAGLMLPVLATQAPLRHLVFVAANVPMPGMSYVDYLKIHPEAKTFPWNRITYDDQGRSLIDWELARDAYYHDVEPSLAREAYSRCLPVATTGYSEICPLETWPEVPSTYIVCEADRATNPEWSRGVSIERLGGPAIEFPGGHSRFLTHPERLAQLLDEIAAPT